MGQGDSEKKGRSLVASQNLGGFSEDCGPTCMSPEASRNWLERRREPLCYSLELDGLGTELSHWWSRHIWGPPLVLLTWSLLRGYLF